MATIGKVLYVNEIDKVTAGYLALNPSVLGGATGATTPGFGDNTIIKGGGTDYGLLLKLRDLETLILAAQDPTTTAKQFTALETTITKIPKQKQVTTLLKQLTDAIQQDCIAAGLSGATSLDLFASYYNTGAGGNWQALLPPDWRILYQLLYGAYPNKNNIYAPPQLTSTGLGSFNGTVWSAGTAVDTTKYAGHIQIFGVVTSTITVASGTATITLEGNGLTANGTLNAPTPFTGSFVSHQLVSQTLAIGTYPSGTILVFTGNAADLYTAISGAQYSVNASGGAFWVGGLSPTAAPSSAPAGLSGTSVPTGTTRATPPT